MTQVDVETVKLAPETRLGAVELTVTDLDRSVPFYEQAIGLRTHARDDGRAALGAGGEDLLVLIEDPDARPAGRASGSSTRTSRSSPPAPSAARPSSRACVRSPIACS